MNLKTDGDPPVTRNEFGQFQATVMETFKQFREDMHSQQKQIGMALEKISQDSRDGMERIYKSTKPQVVLWVMILGVILTIVSIVGGLIGYGFNRETGHISESVNRTTAWVDYMVKRDLEELEQRRTEDRWQQRQNASAPQPPQPPQPPRPAPGATNSTSP